MFTTLRRAALALAATALVLAAGAAPASAAGGMTFEMTLYSKCAVLHSTPTALGSVTQKTSGGTAIETKEAAFDGAGLDTVCFDQPFYAGMRIEGTTGGVTRTFTLPTLALSFDRTTDVVRGTAPAGKQVTIRVNHDPAYWDGTTTTFTRTASSTGAWSVDTTSTFNLRGGESASVQYSNGTDSAIRHGLVPNLVVRIGSTHAWASLNPSQGGSITLRTGGGTLRGRAGVAGGWFSWDTLMEGTFITSSGSGVAVRVGDTVSAPFQPSMSFTVPNLTVTANAATNTISGSCPANRRMQIEVSRTGADDTDPVQCTAAGTYTHVMSLGFDVKSGDRVLVRVRLSQGDIVQRVRAVP